MNDARDHSIVHETDQEEMHMTDGDSVGPVKATFKDDK